MRNCSKCYFYVDERGVYEGHSYCRKGRAIRAKEACPYDINEKDRKAVLKIKIQETSDMNYRITVSFLEELKHHMEDIKKWNEELKKLEEATPHENS